MNRPRSPSRLQPAPAACSGRGAGEPLKQTEHQLQKTVAAFLDRALPPDAFWTSIDSAGRGAIAGAQMKRRGVKRGIYDLLIVYGKATIWVELKSAKGKVTPAQEAFAVVMHNAGHWLLICRSIDELEKHLGDIGIPLRARVSA